MQARFICHTGFACSHLQLGYTYDNLTLNGMTIDQLHSVLEQRKARKRAFAVFSLYGLGFSANVRVKVSFRELLCSLRPIVCFVGSLVGWFAGCLVTSLVNADLYPR